MVKAKKQWEGQWWRSEHGHAVPWAREGPQASGDWGEEQFGNQRAPKERATLVQTVLASELLGPQGLLFKGNIMKFRSGCG